MQVINEFNTLLFYRGQELMARITISVSDHTLSVTAERNGLEGTAFLLNDAPDNAHAIELAHERGLIERALDQLREQMKLADLRREFDYD